MRVNVKKTKRMISENAGMNAIEAKFPCVIYRNGVGSNSTLCRLCRFWVHKRSNAIRGKLVEDSKFKCQACASQLGELAQDCPEIVGKFCYLGNTAGTTEECF